MWASFLLQLLKTPNCSELAWMPPEFMPSIGCDLIIQLRSIPIARTSTIECANSKLSIVVGRTSNIDSSFSFFIVFLECVFFCSSYLHVGRINWKYTNLHTNEMCLFCFTWTNHLSWVCWNWNAFLCTNGLLG